MATYKTAGRQRLLEFLESHPDRQYTAEELCAELDTLSAGISLSIKLSISLYLLVGTILVCICTRSLGLSDIVVISRSP